MQNGFSTPGSGKLQRKQNLRCGSLSQTCACSYSYPRGLTDVFGDLKFIGTMRTVIHTKHQYRTLFTCLLTHPQVKQEVVQIRLVHNSVFHQSAVSWLNSQNCIPSRSISSLHSDIKIANSSLKYFTTSDGIASPLLHTVSLKLALIPYLWQN